MSVPHDPRLTAYALGELSSKEARELETWLERDGDARAELAAIREAASWLGSEIGAETPTLSARRRASILVAAAQGATPLEAPLPAEPQRRRSWVLLAALALPAVAAVLAQSLVQYRRPASDAPAEQARGTIEVAAERTSAARPPAPPTAAESSDAPTAEPMPAPGTPSEMSAAGRDDGRSVARTPERAAPPSIPAPGDERGLALGDGDALASETDDEGEADDLGSEGGVVGGVVGDIVGGIHGTRPSPPTSMGGPKQLTARAGQSLLAIDPNVSPFKVDLPEEYVQHGEEYHATISICVASDGSVSSVEILKPSIPIIDRQIPKVVPLWKYHPYLVDGKPAPFCYGTNYRVVRGP